jgi:hypothetical protein
MKVRIEHEGKVFQGDIPEIIATTTTTTTTTPVVTTTTTNTALKLVSTTVPATWDIEGGTKKTVEWKLSGGSGEYGFKSGGFVGSGTMMWMPKNSVWTIQAFDKADPSKTIDVTIDSEKVGTINFNNTTGTVVPEVVITVPVVTVPVVTQTNTTSVFNLVESGLTLVFAGASKSAKHQNNQTKDICFEVKGGSGFYKYNNNGYQVDFKKSIGAWGSLGSKPNIKITDTQDLNKFVSFDFDLKPNGESVALLFENGQSKSVTQLPSFVPNLPSNRLTDFCKKGEWYEITPKAFLHLSSYVAGKTGQKNLLIGNNTVLYEMNTIDGYDGGEVYFGNHPTESILPVNAGIYGMYSENKTNTGKPQIVGIVKERGNAYMPYKFSGLRYCDYNVTLQPGEKTYNTFEVKVERGDEFNGKINVQFPVFLDGKLVVNKRLFFNGSLFGLGNVNFEQHSINRLTAMLNSDNNKNITVEVQTFGVNDNHKIRVIESNGLEIHPNHISIDGKTPVYYKQVNNEAEGYNDSIFFKEQ